MWKLNKKYGKGQWADKMCDKNKLRNFQKTKLSKIKVKLAWLKSKWLTRCMQPIFKQLFLIKIESEAMVSTSDFYPVLTKSTISWEKSILWALLNDWRKTTKKQIRNCGWGHVYIWIVVEDIYLNCAWGHMFDNSNIYTVCPN